MCGIQLLCTCARGSPTTFDCVPLSWRGPDDYRTGLFDGRPYRFDRLQLTGEASGGMQPFLAEDLFMLANAEIYNMTIEEYDSYALKSDCGALVDVVRDKANATDVAKSLSQMIAEFAVVWCNAPGLPCAARDRYGVRPLYSAVCDQCGQRVFASELYALTGLQYAATVDQWAPGYVYDATTVWPCQVALPSAAPLQLNIPQAFAVAVGHRLTNCEHTSEIGILLSGGLDSTAIAYVAAKSHLEGQPPLRAFTFFHDENSPDLQNARSVAAALNIPLVELLVRPTLDDVQRCIAAIGSYDTTTVRAATMQFVAFTQIRERYPAIKVVLSGEGADELLGGYDYFKAAPSAADAAEECDRLLQDVHRYDGLRVDRTAASHGIEVRLPFLDAHFISTVQAAGGPEVRFPVDAQRIISKSWFRSHIALGFSGIPEAVAEVIVGRAKAAMSDAVGASWVDTVKVLTARRVGETTPPPQPYKDGPTPQTPEEQFYLRCFRTAYPLVQCSPIKYYWMPKWQPTATDPSATTWECFKS